MVNLFEYNLVNRMNMKKTIINASILIVMMLLSYLLLMVSLGLEHNFELRLVNALFMLGGIFWATKKIGTENGSTFNYLNAASAGLVISLTVGIVFSSIIAIYLNLNPSFMAEIKAAEPQGEFLNPLGVSLLIFIEALASGILFTYGSLQYLKAYSPKIANQQI